MRKAISITLSVALFLAGSVCLAQQSGGAQGDTLQKAVKPAPQVKDTAKLPEPNLAEKVYPVRSKSNKLVTLETTYGKMTLELYRDVAPAHADSFVARTRDGFYNGTVFHRVIKDFMIQGGDPKGNGTGNAGYLLKAEFNDLPHEDGTLSMARGQDPNSASSQFFICLARNRMTESLDKSYTVFGHLVRGYDVLHKIGATECMPSPLNPREVSKPKQDIKLIKAYLSDETGKPI